jgi:hypothetical protein
MSAVEPRVFWMPDPEGGAIKSPFVRQPAYSLLQDRVRELKAALRKIISDGDYTAPEGMKRIARSALEGT